MAGGGAAIGAGVEPEEEAEGGMEMGIGWTLHSRPVPMKLPSRSRWPIGSRRILKRTGVRRADGNTKNIQRLANIQWLQYQHDPLSFDFSTCTLADIHDFRAMRERQHASSPSLAHLQRALEEVSSNSLAGRVWDYTVFFSL